MALLFKPINVSKSKQAMKYKNAENIREEKDVDLYDSQLQHNVLCMSD